MMQITEQNINKILFFLVISASESTLLPHGMSKREEMTSVTLSGFFHEIAKDDE